MCGGGGRQDPRLNLTENLCSVHMLATLEQQSLTGGTHKTGTTSSFGKNESKYQVQSPISDI